ncbi:hypothetical protein RFI_07208 [Reticulomyxa filosa]|uniref:MIR domain-containing protein n=1 Tax=Reticulomyxa filosa TaxID=46433 RepID=X6NV94_RETFI|nr:hypothetical protein RFI_07208 [Reticulomyxa filosa]|eukprot:ETO29911.1 hypothetical protein RFI_07208 [Reticulomyxa filosa]
MAFIRDMFLNYIPFVFLIAIVFAQHHDHDHGDDINEELEADRTEKVYFIFILKSFAVTFCLLCCYVCSYLLMCNIFVALNDPVTYGSIIKLEHVTSGYLLHSHDVSYSTGSGQQSVTCYPEFGDTNSLWQVFAGLSSKKQKSTAEQASPIECNDIIRLKHVNTNRWLHSHRGHKAPVSGEQEVTGYGQGLQHSDNGNEFILFHLCFLVKGHEYLNDNHVETGFYLFASKKYNFNENNCRNCPVIGQMEVSAAASMKKGCKWKSSHGVYFRPLEKKEKQSDNANTGSTKQEKSFKSSCNEQIFRCFNNELFVVTQKLTNNYLDIASVRDMISSKMLKNDKTKKKKC